MRHIKNDDFQLIQIGLDENLRLKDIASIIEKDDRAVSRHIKKYRVFKTVFKNENIRIKQILTDQNNLALITEACCDISIENALKSLNQMCHQPFSSSRFYVENFTN